MTELTADQLKRSCETECFDFQTTDELADLDEIVGQKRAVEAIQFGIEIEQEGYNLFAMGPSGIGKHRAISQFLEQRASEQPVPLSWCYVHNFEKPRSPRAIALAPGRASAARTALNRLVADLEVAVESVFEGEDYRARLRAIDHRFDKRHEDALQELSERGRSKGVALTRTQEGFVIAPIVDGEVGSNEDLDELPEEERDRIEEIRDELSRELRATLDEFPRWDRERRDAIRELQRETVAHAIDELFKHVREEFGDSDEFTSYVDDLERAVIEEPDTFLAEDEAAGAQNPMERGRPFDAIERFSVNVLVDHDDADGAPIVYEDDPTVENLLGHIDYDARYGVLFTNFSLIREGALHRANGGYLMVNARSLLSDPTAWTKLKRTLYAGEIRVQAAKDQSSAPTTLTLTPDPIPLHVKVVMVGERETYYALREFDPDMDELFKVTADFDTHMDRDDEAVRTYARLIATLIRREDLRAFDAAAVARVVEHSSRMARDSDKLSTHMRTVADLLRESDYWAARHDVTLVGVSHVQTAIDKQIERGSRIRDLLAEQITDEQVVIHTDGSTIGQVNGLSVIHFGQTTFGRPTRISAAVSIGSGEVVDIEREVELGGPIHSKGIMILKGFLASRYAQEHPLSLSASIVFEQSYSGIDGDSASTAEACALLSALSGAPIRQSIAITGAIDQLGFVQAVGGVNEKIEGFFEVCQHRGLTGDQGVIIPQANLSELMLRDDVVTAVEDGQFAVWTVEHVDEALQLLTGREPAELHNAVDEKLTTFARRLRSFRSGTD